MALHPLGTAARGDNHLSAMRPSTRAKVEGTRGTMWARVGLERAPLEIQAASLGLLANRVRACRWRRRLRQAFAFSSASPSIAVVLIPPIHQKYPEVLLSSVSPADAILINRYCNPIFSLHPLHWCAASRRTHGGCRKPHVRTSARPSPTTKFPC